MFETTGVLNADVIKSFKNNLLSPMTKKSIIQLMIILGTASSIAVISIFNRSVGIKFAIFLFVVFIVIYLYIPYHTYKNNIRRIEEINGKKEVKINVYFDEEGVRITNLNLETTALIKYDMFERLVQTDNHYMLFTKYNEGILIFKDCLDKNQIDEFSIFIKDKCKIKIFK